MRGTALYNLAQMALARGDHATAARMLKEGVTPSEQVGQRGGIAYLLEGLAAVAEAQDEAERSARLFGAAEGLLRAVEAPIYKHHRPNRSSRPLESAPWPPCVPGWARDASRRHGPRDER